MSVFRLIVNNLLFHRRMHLAVALGVAAATAVLTGALLVGDSVRGSLRHLALDRLGQINELLIADRFFRSEMASEVSSHSAAARYDWETLPAIVVPSVTVETQEESSLRRASGVTLVAAGEKFWNLGRDDARPKKLPEGDEVVLNEPLADELGVKVGDTLVVRLAKAAQIPADSALGRKTDRTTSLAGLNIVAIVPARSLGRFSIHPAQTTPRNIYLPLPLVQEALEVPQQVNCLLATRGGFNLPADEAEASEALHASLNPRLSDYGLSLEEVRIRFGGEDQARDIAHYFQLTSDRMVLDDATAAVAMKALAEFGPQPVLTYLANDIAKVRSPKPEVGGQRSEVRGQKNGIPYSMITAINPSAGGPLVDDAGDVLPPLADDEIVLNRWAAEDQQVQVGDRVRVTWFEPETAHGQQREKNAEFRVAAIVPLTEPSFPFTRRRPARYDEPPTAANDPNLTPTVKGITDQETIDNWDAPFEYDRTRLRPQDDQYWRNHRTTPKAFVSLAAGQRLWGSRFGKVTSIKVPAGEGSGFEVQRSGGGQKSAIEAALVAELHKHQAELGLAFRPIKQQALDAASGTTPFDVLFLLLSMFIIAAALMLVWLLFRLGVEQRAAEVGLLQSLGWPANKTARLLVLEGGLVAALGGLVGVLGGIGYAWLMLAGLRTWWVGAIATPFLQLYVTPASLIVGYLLGVLVSLATIWLSLRALSKVPAKQLLAGATQVQRPGRDAHSSRPGRLGLWLALGLFASAAALAVVAANLGGEAQAGAFLGAGAAFLAAALLLIRWRLMKPSPQRIARSVPVLAIRNAGRNAGRSVATIALMASASFLIVAVSSFRLDPSEAGIGGFDLLAESSEPIFADLNSAAARQELFRGQADDLEGTTILPLRVKPGDDASCRNLYQPSQPRVLGVSDQFVRYFDDPQTAPRFAFAGSAAETAEQRANPWRVLRGSSQGMPLPERVDQIEPIPVILDKNTAMYSLKLYFGIGEEFAVTYGGNQTVHFRVAGLLSNSVLQGSLLIGEEDFKRLFPEVSGYRSFLIKTPPQRQEQVVSVLEDRLGDEGFDAADSRQRLADLLAVQNTYISTFQSLGALGLVLGTFGLAAVQLRNVFERRKELALMRAVGFRGVRLGEMVLLENLLLLLAGLTTGTLAALLSTVPHMLLGGARVPLLDLAVMLGVVLAVGLATGWIAVRATLRAPVLAALRGG